MLLLARFLSGIGCPIINCYLIQLFQNVAVCLIAGPKIADKTYIVEYQRHFLLLLADFQMTIKQSMSENMFPLAYTIKESLCRLADNVGMGYVFLKISVALKSRYREE